MTLKFVDSVPKNSECFTQERRLVYNKAKRLVEEFVNDHRKVALIQCDPYEQYKNSRSLATTMRRIVRELHYPVRIHRRGNDVYLAKD